jgi:hypothetical protein
MGLTTILIYLGTCHQKAYGLMKCLFNMFLKEQLLKNILFKE